jgi:hypothetical protein
MTTRLNSIPPVVAIEDYWGGIVASGASFSSSVVLGIVSGTNIRAEWSPETSIEEVVLTPISAAEVATEGLALFLGGALSGTGLLEHFRIAGVSATGAPVQSTFVNWGFANSIQDVSLYDSVYGGTSKFGDARKVALRKTGLIYIRFSGSTAAQAPVVGHYVQPSSGTDGYAELCPSGSASVNINYGKVYGYASGSNIGGLTTTGTGVAAQFVLTHFERGNW